MTDLASTEAAAGTALAETGDGTARLHRNLFVAIAPPHGALLVRRSRCGRNRREFSAVTGIQTGNNRANKGGSTRQEIV